MSNQDVLSELNKLLGEYLNSIEKSSAVFLSTMDGHLLLEITRSEMEVTQITPMGGSLLSISETIANALLNQELDDVILMMKSNILALLKVHDNDSSLYLGIVSPRQVNLGKLLVKGKTTISEIKSLLDDMI